MFGGHDLSHSMHLANEIGLTALASVSSSRPPMIEFVAAANLLMFLLYICHMACPCDFEVLLFCSSRFPV